MTLNLASVIANLSGLEETAISVSGSESAKFKLKIFKRVAVGIGVAESFFNKARESYATYFGSSF